MRRATGVPVLAALLAVAGGSLTAGTATASSTRHREPRRTFVATAGGLGLDALRGIVPAFERIRFQHANRDLQLGFAIPCWFDADDEAPGPVRFAARSSRSPTTSSTWSGGCTAPTWW